MGQERGLGEGGFREREGGRGKLGIGGKRERTSMGS